VTSATDPHRTQLNNQPRETAQRASRASDARGVCVRIMSRRAAHPDQQRHRRDSPVTCHSCGKRVSRRGRSQIYCSRRCRQRAYWDRRVLAGISAIVTHDAGPSTTPCKSISKIKDLQRTKTRPRDSFSTPVNVLGGGQWRWPNSTRLDAQTLAKILRAEIGSACRPSRRKDLHHDKA
jgi:hypothetical protein